MATENPYVPRTTAVSVIENAESRTVEIIDEYGQTPIGGSATIVTVDLSTGGRAFIERQLRVRSTDGRLIDPAEQIYACGCGCNQKPRLTKHAVVFCALCQVPLALDHAKTWDDGRTQVPVCPACFARGRWMRALVRWWRWLMTL
jgi:hypothetical protein